MQDQIQTDILLITSLQNRLIDESIVDEDFRLTVKSISDIISKYVGRNFDDYSHFVSIFGKQEENMRHQLFESAELFKTKLLNL